MKRFAFFSLLLFLYYIAAMYGSPALMAVFLAQLFLLPVLAVLSRYLGKHLSISFQGHLIPAEMGEKFVCAMNLENTSGLPVSLFKARITVCAGPAGKAPDTPIWKTAGKAVRQTVRKTVTGSCARGRDVIAFETPAGHCGLYEMRIRWVKTYDYLALFFRKETGKSRAEAAVFPPRADMRIEISAMSSEGTEQSREDMFLPGNDYDEIRQIREYREGDPLRHIHWNQTARTDQLWVKEYEEDKKERVALYLDLNGLREKTPDQKDQYYTLLYAVLRGVLKEGHTILACWEERGQPRIFKTEVRDDRECRQLLLLLYRREDRLGGERTGGLKPERYGAMRLGADLSWHAGGRLVRRFSGESLRKELEEKIYRI